MYTFEKKDKKGILKINISKEEWEELVEKAYEANKAKYKVQGFRNGKAPRKVIEQTYGDTIFFDDAFESGISKEYYSFLDANKNIIPVGQPAVEMNSFTADKGVEATITFDLVPEFKLPSFNEIKTKKKTVEVSEQEIDNEIERERQAHARYVQQDGPVENGDFATIDFDGFLNGEKFEGGDAKDYRLEIGSHTFIDGFEDQIIGMKVGQQKDINVTFPENYPAENLKGQPVIFKIKLNKIEKKDLPQVDDKFISDITEFDTLDEYKKSIRENLKKINEERAERDFEVDLLDEIAEKSNIEVPNSMVDHEIHHMVEDFEHRLSHQGMTLQSYLDYIGKTIDEFKKEREEDAVKNIKTRLVIQKIISENAISASNEDIDKLVVEYATRYNMSLDEFKKAMRPEDYAYFENNAIMTKVLDFIKSKNK